MDQQGFHRVAGRGAALSHSNKSVRRRGIGIHVDIGVAYTLIMFQYWNVVRSAMVFMRRLAALGMMEVDVSILLQNNWTISCSDGQQR